MLIVALSNVLMILSAWQASIHFEHLSLIVRVVYAP